MSFNYNRLEDEVCSSVVKMPPVLTGQAFKGRFRPRNRLR